MEFQFKKQQYQTDAVTNTVEVFAGQPYQDGNSYLMGHETTGLQMLMDEYGRRNAPLNIGLTSKSAYSLIYRRFKSVLIF